MIGFPSRDEIVWALIGVAAVELGVLAWFRSLWRLAPAVEPKRWPGVVVYSACAGLSDALEDRIARFAAQDYPGRVRYIIATPMPDGEVTKKLSDWTRAQGLDCLVIGSGVAPRQASGKIVDLLYAMERADPKEEIFAFVDLDLGVEPSWLRCLVRPLVSEPSVGVTTASMLYVPAGGRLPAWSRLLWTACGMPFFALRRNITGQSFAIRRSDFEALKVAALWATTLLEDLALTRRVRTWDKSVRFVPEAVAWAADDASWSETLGVFNKWIRAYRVYDPLTWAMGLALTSFNAYVVVRVFSRGFDPELLALWWALRGVSVGAVLANLKARLPDRLPGFGWAGVAVGAVLAPLLQAVYSINFIASFGDQVRWGPFVYRMRGPSSVEVISGDR